MSERLATKRKHLYFKYEGEEGWIKWQKAIIIFCYWNPKIIRMYQQKLYDVLHGHIGESLTGQSMYLHVCG